MITNIEELDNKMANSEEATPECLLDLIEKTMIPRESKDNLWDTSEYQVGTIEEGDTTLYTIDLYHSDVFVTTMVTSYDSVATCEMKYLLNEIVEQNNQEHLRKDRDFYAELNSLRVELEYQKDLAKGEMS